jgi:hypothetical protein
VSEELVSFPVGVVVERRKAKSGWIDFVWRPLSVLAGIPATEPWTKLTEDGEATTFYSGAANVELHPAHTTYYRDNLASGEPSLWVVLRPSSGASPYELIKVTADPFEGEAMTETGGDIVEKVAMPGTVREQIAAYVDKYHVERPFYKRQRERTDPESIGRRGIVKENKG